MRLHNLKPTFKKERKKRIGRGGKRGTYSGRGQKGQKARAGRKIRPAERDLFQRLPKLKGLKNRSLKGAAVILNVGSLEKYFEAGVLNRVKLMEKKIIKKISAPVKILSDGETKKAYVIEGIPISKKARLKIEAAGGSVKLVQKGE